MTGRRQGERFAHPVASGEELRIAAGVALTAAVLAAATSAAGAHALGPSETFSAAATAASLVAMLVSSTILHNRYRATGHVPFAVLGAAFAGTAAFVAPQLLLAPHGLVAAGIGLDARGAAWQWFAARAAFIALVGIYVCSESVFARNLLVGERGTSAARAYAGGVVTAATFVCGLIVACQHRLPPFLTGNAFTPLAHTLVNEALLAAAAVVLTALLVGSNFRNATHVWLAVAVALLIVETLVASEGAPRFTFAWYVATCAAFAWQSVFVVVQLAAAYDQLTAFAADKRDLLEETLHDALTGLFNRRGFDQRLDAMLVECRSARAPLALIALDIDHFKLYNDYFGHPAGDEVIRTVGGAIAETANRPTDACCRIGGEEFAVVLGMTDDAGALIVAERIRAAILKLRIEHAPKASNEIVTVSIGIAVHDGSMLIHPKDIAERADKALYQAKRLGRDRIVSYNDQRETTAALRAV
jgi:diguanylate cyclase (GGDEF)-like protein